MILLWKHSKPSSIFYSTHFNLSFLCKYTFMYVYLWVEAKGQPQVYLLPLVALHLPFWDILTCWDIHLLASEFQGRDLPVFLPKPRITCIHYHFWFFYVDAKDPNSGAHACVPLTKWIIFPALSFFPSFKKRSQSNPASISPKYCDHRTMYHGLFLPYLVLNWILCHNKRQLLVWLKAESPEVFLQNYQTWK